MEIRKLNTLRGIAALIVIVSHYSNTANLLNRTLGDGAGQLGVMLFFLLSGFLMSYLYMEKECNVREVYRYAVARVARVVPLFLLVVLCSYLVKTSGFNNVLYDIPNKESLFSHLALLSGHSVLWTIPVEIQFYLVFVFLWWFWRKRQSQLYILISFLMVGLVVLGFPRKIGSLFGIPYDTALFPSLPYFLMGLILGQLYGKWKIPDNLPSRMYLLSLLLIPLLYPKIHLFLTGRNHVMWNDVGVFFSISLVFFLITFLVPDDCTLISNRIGDFLGKISFSLYLLHLPVLWQIENQAVQSPVLFLPIFLVLTVAVSSTSYFVIENPLRLAIRAVALNNRLHSDSKKRRSFPARLFAAGE